MTTPTEQELDQKRTRLRQWIPEDEQRSATRGVDHLAGFAKDLEETAAFYAEVMGMPVVKPGATTLSMAASAPSMSVGSRPISTGV